MVILSLFRNNEKVMTGLLDALSARFPEISSLMFVVNPKANDTLTDLEVKLYKGKDHLIEEMEGLKFRISPKSFFQTNTSQAHQLYSVARDFAALTGTETVYDLYTGTGTIALFLASACRQILGIEYVQEAIDDAKLNAALNGILNASFHAGDMKDLLNQAFIEEHGQPDVIVTDPPRNGMHADVVKTILDASPRKIVYVSCNPATQARDIEMLSQRYNVVKSQPVDMFPYTHHVENVALLELINS
jgi:23S rRNA (uracil1939-C5)-methyltransferase